MKKNLKWRCLSPAIRKTLLIMKLSFILFFAFSMQLSASVLGQQVSIRTGEISLRTVLEELKVQTGTYFMFNEDDMDTSIRVELDMHNVSLEKALEEICKQAPFNYEVIEDFVVLTKKRPVVIGEVKQKKKFKEIQGVVTDSEGLPLPGVSVVVKGTTVGVSTTIDGHYHMTLPENTGTIVFSFVGMETKEFPYTGQFVINVILYDDSESLNEVIVTGYQTISKERATGSYVKLSGDMINERPVSDISEAFIGVTPGVVGAKQPNGDTRFMVRGQGTLQSSLTDRDPLLVVDGYPVEGFRAIDYYGSSSPFGNINPNDIKSITFLKDASATSIYGAKAANGVIVITTKSAKEGEKMNIDFSSFVSVGEKLDLDYLTNMASTKSQIEFDEMAMDLYADMVFANASFVDPYKGYSYNSYRSEHRDNLFALRAGDITQDEYDNRRANLISRDGKWKDQYDKYILRNQVLQQHSLSLSGSGEKNTYKFTGMYQNDLTSLQYNKREKVILGFNNTYKLNKKLKFSIGTNLHMSTNSDNSALNMRTISDLGSNLSPYDLLLDDNGGYVDNISSSQINLINKPYSGKKFSDSWRYNLLEEARINEDKNISKVFNIRIQAGLDYKIIEGLNFSSKFQYEKNSTKRERIDPQESFIIRKRRNEYSTYDAATDSYVTTLGDGATVSNFSELFEAYNFRNQLAFDKQIGEKHQLTSLLGVEVRSDEFTNLPNTKYYEYDENSLSYTNSFRKATEKHMTIFGYENFPYSGITPGSLKKINNRSFSSYFNIAYTFDKKYTLTSNLRADASNFLSKDTRSKFSPFWSVGASWNISEESFMENIDAVDNLKFRASLGIAGVPAGRSSQSTVSSIANYNGILTTNNENFARIRSTGNPSLTWEKSRTLNLGLDFSLFRSKLYGSIEYYNRLSYDVLSRQPASPYVQSASYLTVNDGEILNEGLELSLGSSLKIRDNISWNGNFNLAYNHNELVKSSAKIGAYQGSYYNMVGFALDALSSIDIRGYNEDGSFVIAANDGQLYTLADYSTYSTLMNKRRDLDNGETYKNDKFKKYEGRSTPPVNIGFTNTFKIHDFTLRAIITGQFGHKIKFNGNYNSFFNYRNHNKELEKAWRVGDSQTPFVGFPVYESADLNSSDSPFMSASNLAYYASSLFDRGDNIRLQEVYLGYKVPSKILKKTFVKSINVYTQVKNLGTIWVANKRGLDPLNLPGTLKAPVIYTFGLKVNI